MTAEPDTAPATEAPASWIEYEVHYTTGDNWTTSEYFQIPDGRLVIAELPAMIAARHEYHDTDPEKIAIVRIEVVGDSTTGLLLGRWLRKVEKARNVPGLNGIGFDSHIARVTGPFAADRARDEVLTRRLRERERQLTGPAPATHEHEQGIYVQPLPACLAPTAEALLAQPLLDLPRPGDLVVIDAGRVHWLERDDPHAQATRDNTALRDAAMAGYDACRGADWDHIGNNDPDEPGLEEDDDIAIATTWDLLIDLANQAETDATTH
jgi:hypothetical protein